MTLEGYNVLPQIASAWQPAGRAGLCTLLCAMLLALLLWSRGLQRFTNSSGLT